MPSFRSLADPRRLFADTSPAGALLLRLPLSPLLLGLWLGCVWSAPHPGWLLAPCLLGLFVPRRLPGTLALGALGLAASALALRAAPPERCPAPGVVAQWLGQVVALQPTRDGRTSIELDVRAELRGTTALPLQCRVLISAGRRPPEVLEGDFVWLPAVDLEAPVHLFNPGVVDSAARLSARGIARVGSLPDGAGVLALRHAGWPLQWLARLRARAGRLIAALPAGDGREVVRALALGQRATFTPDLQDAFRDSGLRHLLTLGLLYLSLWFTALALLCAKLWAQFERLALWLPARRAGVLGALPVPLLYGGLAGAFADEPTAARAALVGLTLAVALGAGRGRAHALHSFTLAAIVLLCVRPEAATDLALLWSLAALVGIALLAAPLLQGRAGARDPLVARLWSHVVAAAAIGVAAFLATAPLQVAADHQLALLTVPLGLLGLGLVIPACGLAQLGALLHSSLLLRWALAPAALLAHLARCGAGLSLAPVPLGAGLALAVGALVVAALALAQRRHPRLALVLAALTGLLLLAQQRWPKPAPRLRLTFLSVGHGDAAVIETPHGHVMLIDGGGAVVGDFDPGREVVLPFLRWRAIAAIDAVVLSHPHPDHANGLPAVVAALPVAELWHSGEPCPLPACTALAELARAHGTRTLTLGAAPFTRTLDGVTFTLLSPQLPAGYDPALGPNDNSLVLLVQYGDFRALMTGDIEATAEARLVAATDEARPVAATDEARPVAATDEARPVAATDDLHAFLLKAPHHGSDTSSTPALLSAVHPAVVVFSVGPRNRFHFPRADVWRRYAQAGALGLRTDLDGAIAVETDGRTVTVTPTAPGTSAQHFKLEPLSPSAEPW